MKKENIEFLKNNGVGVIPTDTVYGLACSVFSETALKRLFKLKGREENKPPVILISDLKELDLFGAEINGSTKMFLDRFWPGQISIIFNIKSELAFLDKGRGVAIRLPADKKVLKFLKQTGPLSTSSANPQGLPPAKNISEAKKYFTDQVDFYEDGGELDSPPSTLVDLRSGKLEVLRHGAVMIKQ